LVSERAARELARGLREAVTSGTGRQLASHEGRIAGKTGTAEIDEASPHAWFVGFAPYGTGTAGDSPPTRRRIAFAVLLEHGGYGGRAAASIAGQVTSAARSLGLIK
jgi:peptidoglycan glycosyltransferase